MLKQLLSELKPYIEPEYKAGATNFFKEPIKPLGVRTPTVRKIARAHFKEIDKMTKREVFELCDSLLGTGKFELGLIAFAFIRRRIDDLTKADFKILESWIHKYIHNWAWCDDFCTHNIAQMLAKYPELAGAIKSWTKSKNRWLKRAAAVSFVPAAAHGEHHLDVFIVATILLHDTDDLVQKGYGWMLKSAANFDQEAVFNFVMEHKDKMPRTALRYAIEKMTTNLKQKAMRVTVK
ncbi:DNA alkylation repair protein [Candidatus Uhrbacteria bacterium CG_4_9_14_0_2_um_filter_41_50]|uniref:DNA alkylation repair protein n=1 Tax=Candidatus Uhrbacteria bacterium CG_4_9_14_0_2_um_filter_41_50 TaxID=1975031 RepID=A0A2M8EPE6_9BACT|nr:MAG: DNA alkylation repair protein [Candidatus Uhrbacteria bacterium CG_4_10_14_3_um_filter_41_21]PIZ54353.1 MAG: DNA alkylation repair protein [Candidatus Uhrbacteria bacterium CG_4_10_14_0_2_um_filter_41_21]PJB84939.1 MAG: DNA alkylation repair protein [Candidatus Uhrbacteria bacterium CG_4_9_14_0_8_um_filter_41_16]PJC24616.1 MAG: DNA alkylation repair protein [Candidatus Uhrbacteria bacterium CG_4_9_14_0_2_um_filter_41_50]PJE74766.1 MAG: DNA alkylation repair protein [Candidatus Uhrbacter